MAFKNASGEMMSGPKMVHEGIFIGNGYDADQHKFAGSTLHCAKDPWYQQAYIPAILPNVKRISYNEMALNMVDANTIMYFPDQMINAGLDFITERLAEGDPILVHCNMGLSRSPSMVFIWMFEHGFLDDKFRYAMPQFKELYPSYCPGNGIYAYVKKRCDI